MKLDAIDKKILEILQNNGNITNSQLAKDIGLSPAPTLERVKKLEQSGIVKSYHAKLDTKQLGLGVTIFITITLSSHKVGQISSFVEKITALPEVLGCYNVTGNGDFLIKILTEDIASYHKLILEKLSQIEEIGNMSSMIVLADYKPDAIIKV
ncbi:MAG: Lrp/AsnC family transcriptional regulator [Bacteroidetes bacterium]|nr:MAG: Lrp/AsnC family transcriptional regulator [Bacteroidota bacterium]